MDSRPSRSSSLIDFIPTCAQTNPPTKPENSMASMLSYSDWGKWNGEWYIVCMMKMMIKMMLMLMLMRKRHRAQAFFYIRKKKVRRIVTQMQDARRAVLVACKPMVKGKKRTLHNADRGTK